MCLLSGRTGHGMCSTVASYEFDIGPACRSWVAERLQLPLLKQEPSSVSPPYACRSCPPTIKAAITPRQDASRGSCIGSKVRNGRRLNATTSSLIHINVSVALPCMLKTWLMNKNKQKSTHICRVGRHCGGRQQHLHSRGSQRRVLACQQQSPSVPRQALRHW